MVHLTLGKNSRKYTELEVSIICKTWRVREEVLRQDLGSHQYVATQGIPSHVRGRMDPIAVYLMYRELFDRTPVLSELPPLISGLDCAETVGMFCQMNADLRLSKRKPEALASVQQQWAGFMFDDETIRRMKQRLGTAHMADRPVFESPQILNIMKLVIQNSAGDLNPGICDDERYKLGTACLMMNDLFLTEREKEELSSGTREDKMRAITTQTLGTFELINTSAITHVIYRSRIMFKELLAQSAVVNRIKNGCAGFDFEEEFARIVGMPITHWIFLLFAFYAYLASYVAEDGSNRLEYLSIDRKNYRGTSRISSAQLEIVLRAISCNLSDFRDLLEEQRPTDWRFDFVPFRSKPLVEVVTDKFVCPDIGFLIEKMHSGVFWAINDGLSRSDRLKLFSAWGILFEEYVNWFLGNCHFKQPLLFLPAPKWSDGTECFDGALVQDSRFVPMEYKGGFLRVEARYSGDLAAFEQDLDLKIGKGCDQLAGKIEALFDKEAHKRRTLSAVPLTHVTRVVPVLVVQDQILRSPFVNWWLNRRFNQSLARTQLRPCVTIEPLNVVSVSELETMAESAEGGTFDILHGLQLRCLRDPEMQSDLHNFLLDIPGYEKGKSPKIEKILADQWTEIEQFIFGSLPASPP
jgi:hypothetical protein